MSAALQVLADPAQLTAALKAVQAFVSQDETRQGIRNVYAEVSAVGNGLVLTATDGHTMCSVEIQCSVERKGVSARLNAIAVDGLLSKAKASKGFPTAIFDLEDHGGAQFPEYQRATPAQTNGGKADAVTFFDGKYIARIGHVQKCLKGEIARIQQGTDYAPMRVDIEGELGKATIVIMPRRGA